MRRLAELVLRYRVLVVAGVALVSAFFASGLGRVRVESDIVKYLRQDLPEVRLVDYIGEEYGGTQLALIAIEAEDVFSLPVLQLVRDLTEAYHALPGVSSVTSLTNILDIRKAEGGIEVTKLVEEDDLPRDPEALRRLREYALSKELYRGKLVSPDGRFALIVVKLRGDADKPALARKIRRVTQDKLKAFPQVRAYYGGVPLQMEEVDRIVVGDMRRLIPIVAIVVVIVLFAGFHTVRGVVLPLTVVALATLWSIGLMAWTGIPLSIISNAMPVLLIAIGTAYSIHLLARHREESRVHPPDRALTETLKGVGTPILLAGLTTIAGFLSFLGSYLSPVTHFGIFTAFGVGAALLLTVAFLPAVLSFLPPPKARIASLQKGLTPLSRAMGALEGFVLKYERIVLSAGLLVLVWAVWSIPRISTQVNMAEYFPSESEIRKSSDVMRKNFGGDLPVQILVRGDLKDPFVLSEMYRTEKFLRTVHGINHPQSLADLLAEMNDAMNDRHTIPDTREGVANLLFMLEGEEILPQLVKGDYSEGLIQARFSKLDTRLILEGDTIVGEYLRRMPEELVVASRDSLPAFLKARLDSFLARRTAQEVLWDAEFRGGDLDLSLREVADVLLASLRSPWMPSEEVLKELAADYEEYLSEEADVEVPPEAIPSLVRGLVALVRKGGFPKEAIDFLLRRALPPEEDPELVESTLTTLKDMTCERFREDRVRQMEERLLFLFPPSLRRDREFLRDLKGDLWRLLSEEVALPKDLFPEAKGKTVSFKFFHAGTLPIYHRVHENLVKSQIQSLILAFVFIALMVSLQLRSFGAGLLATVPLLIVVAVNFGLMGTLGIPLDNATMMVASIAIGIGIDYTIHFLSRFRQELGSVQDERVAFERALRTTGRAILLNAATVGLGFLVLLLADLVPLRRFGWMVALTMGTSALAAIALLPALVLAGGKSFVDHNPTRRSL